VTESRSSGSSKFNFRSLLFYGRGFLEKGFVPDSFYRKKFPSLLREIGEVKSGHRERVFRDHFENPLCNLGQSNPVSKDEDPEWFKPWMPAEEQLRYKVILFVEGNEFATNLKWIAQSNSLCFMTRPKFESWFMEGTLKNGIHYVELKDDYSDLPEKMNHYLQNPEEAKEIIGNLNRYYRQFTDERRELLISLLVVGKYLQLSGQLKCSVPQADEAIGDEHATEQAREFFCERRP
jgi:hypothetical protein